MKGRSVILYILENEFVFILKGKNPDNEIWQKHQMKIHLTKKWDKKVAIHSGSYCRIQDYLSLLIQFKFRTLKLFIFSVCLILFLIPLTAKETGPCLTVDWTDRNFMPGLNLITDEFYTIRDFTDKKSKDSTKEVLPSAIPITLVRPPVLVRTQKDSIKLAPRHAVSLKNDLNNLSLKNNFTGNLLRRFITNQTTALENSGSQSVSYFEQFGNWKINSIRFVRLDPFGTSIMDTSQNARLWIEKAGNKLHMNTSKKKLRMHLLFKSGDVLNPLLMAENEKLIRDLSYIEDVFFLLEPNKVNPDEVDVIVISKDKFEYAVNLNLNPDYSDVQFVNENMFGFGHRMAVGMAQRNQYLPEMGIYSSYQVQNILGRFINSTIGFSDTYLKKGWNISVDKKFLTSSEENAGGFSLDQVSKFNYIAEDHPIGLDTTVAYFSTDSWFIHAFPKSNNLLDKTLLTFRYYHQDFNHKNGGTFGDSEFFRNHEFLLTGISFSRRNLYKNNLVYGYGITEDIPYGYYCQINAGLDKSQFGVWPYLGFSYSTSFVGRDGRYCSGKFALDGFVDDGSVKQGTIQLSTNFFSRKRIIFNDPFRAFINIELLSGINRLPEEYLKIDGRFGIRDFYSNDTKGKNRLKFNFEVVRYLKWNIYGFRFSNYVYSDLAFLSEKMESMFSSAFYAGIGTGLRIHNESLVFKIIDIRFSWFPVLPDGMSPFGANLQGLSKSRFEDFLGRKPEVIRFQ